MQAHVNMDYEDIEDREAKARQASEIITRSVSGSASPTQNSYQYGAIESIDSSTSYSVYSKKACCGIMSPVRRTFCLIVLFDLILTFIIWVIYTQLLGHSLRQAFKKEVVEYTFKTSLFDSVLCSAWRFVPLLLAYALFRIHNPYIVALTTFGTCVFLVAKVFLFKFSGEENHNNIVCYLLLLVSFIISWIETWFLDFKVLPRERKDLERQRLLSSSFNGSAPYQRLSAAPRLPGVDENEYYSPVDSNVGSDDEDHEGFRSMPHSQRHSRQQSIGSATLSLADEDADYQNKAADVWNKAWNILHAGGWNKESGENLYEGIVSTQTFPNMGKLFRIEGYIDAPPALCFEQVVTKADEMTVWNPTVEEVKVLRVISRNTDISYTVAAEAVGGLVSSRDFVSLRTWKSKNGILFSSGSAINYPECPPIKKHVRGENRPGGWACMPVPGKPNMCKFVWICNTDLKGWIPKYLVDQSLTAVLKDFLKSFRIRMKQLEPGMSV